ncbi:MAG TPA: cupin domain-containing protein [Solirubrobacteraceae bacterium]|nr:cupin domain-containing protein [Solirubrobacteraceae bacterium]
MPNYTIKNLMDIEDMAAGRDIGIEVRFARSHLDSEHLGVTYMRFEPDTRSPFAHSHGEQEEAYLVTSGSGRLKVGDDVLELGPWDVVRVAAAAVRAFESGPDGLEMVIVGSDRPEAGDGEISPMDEFWPS